MDNLTNNSMTSHLYDLTELTGASNGQQQIASAGNISSNSELQLDNLSNLLIHNSFDDDTALLDKYESEMERNINENLLMEKDQSNQRLFQSFQTSACAVAQMFKDKTTANQQTSPPGAASGAWESFQNSAGAITVLYKDSLEACRVHMDLGVHIGQQRKLKDIINWIKKKKKRSIRKDELISFLIGKQYPSQNQMFNSPNFFNINSASSNSQQQQQAANASMFLGGSSCGHRRRGQQQQQQVNGRNTPSSLVTNNSNSQSTSASVLGSSVTNICTDNSNEPHAAVETDSDLATFREALIMHNRSRDTPLNRNHHHHHNHSNHHHTHHHPSLHSHHIQHPTSNSSQQQQQQQQVASQSMQPNCDDLDCFFCEQIATHIEHKRTSANLNFDMESPTRKRSRFY